MNLTRNILKVELGKIKEVFFHTYRHLDIVLNFIREMNRKSFESIDEFFTFMISYSYTCLYIYEFKFNICF